MYFLQEYLFSGVNEGDMADHTPPLESGQLLSPELPILASPPPPAMVNGDGPQQVHSHLFALVFPLLAVSHTWCIMSAMPKWTF